MMILKIFINYPDLIREFFFREIHGRFAGSFGGKIWLILNPLSQIIIYIFLFSIVLKIKLNLKFTGTQSFTIFLLSGMFFWLILSEAIFKSISIIYENSNLIKKVAFPVETLPVVAGMQSFFINGLGLLIFLIFLIFKGFFNFYWIYLPLLIFIFFIFVIGLCLILSAISPFIKDVQHIINILMFVWFYATPIVYPEYLLPEGLKFILYLNPVYPFIYIFRVMIFKMELNIWQAILGFIWSFLFFGIGYYLFFNLKESFSDVL